MPSRLRQIGRHRRFLANSDITRRKTDSDDSSYRRRSLASLRRLSSFIMSNISTQDMSAHSGSPLYKVFIQTYPSAFIVLIG